MITKRQPNLFLVGFQKCGSSSLFDLLCEHPKIKGTTPKETFTLVDESYQHYSPNEHVMSTNFCWENYFKSINLEGIDYLLEGSVCNFYQKTALSYIEKLADKKVVFIIRDPIRRLRSSYNYFTTKLNYNIPSISKYIEILSSKDASMIEKLSSEGAKYGLVHGKYVSYIQQWEERIGKNNVHVVLFERLIKTPHSELEKLMAFLEIESYKGFVVPHSNPSKAIKNRYLHFLLKRGLGKYKLGRFRILRNLYHAFNTGKKRTHLTEGDLKWLRTYYQKEYDYIEKA